MDLLSPSYPRLWRWHFFAGLFLSPTLVTLSVTGLIYLFKPQVEPRLYKKWLEAPPSAKTLTHQAQAEAAVAAFPGAAVFQVIPSPGPGRTAQVFLNVADGKPLTVYVDPADGRIAGVQRTDRTLMSVAESLHGSLMLGKPGAVIMELTAGWAFILTASGLFLWWPRGKTGMGGVLWPRLSLPGRGWWKDLHAVPAFYLSGLIILFLATGIPWTGVMGDWIGRAAQATGTGAPPGFGPSPFKSEASDGRPPLPLDRLVEVARERLPAGAEPEIVPSREGRSAAVIRWMAPAMRDRAYIHVDAITGKVLADYRWKDFGSVGKAIQFGVFLHMGRFGVWNQLLNAFVALGVIGLAMTGVVLWWKRRPGGAGLGAPEAPESSRLPKGFLWAAAVFGVMAPLTGLSLAAVLAADAVCRHQGIRGRTPPFP
jgi:uncharacterized iron-regulated membrane protein